MDVETKQRLRNISLPTLAARIKQVRIEAGSHDKLAERAGTSRQHVINLEKGRNRPGIEMLTRIAEASEHDLDWFLEPEVAPSPFRSAA